MRLQDKIQREGRVLRKERPVAEQAVAARAAV
jgi:hypothetical protein